MLQGSASALRSLTCAVETEATVQKSTIHADAVINHLTNDLNALADFARSIRHHASNLSKLQHGRHLRAGNLRRLIAALRLTKQVVATGQLCCSRPQCLLGSQSAFCGCSTHGARRRVSLESGNEPQTLPLAPKTRNRGQLPRSVNDNNAFNAARGITASSELGHGHSDQCHRRAD